MTKPELGTKHLCASCGTKFYDFKKPTATCPKCGTVANISTKGSSSRSAKAAAPVKAVVDEEVAEKETDVEIVSLEEADEENIGPAGIDDDEDDVEDIDDGDVDDTFLEEDEDDDDAVPGIVVARDDDEEI